MGKGGGTTTQNTIAEPWEAAQPFLRDLIGDAWGSYNVGSFATEPWPGIRTAPQSGMTTTANQMVYNTATGDNPFLSAAAGAAPWAYGYNPQSGLSQAGQEAMFGTAAGYNPFLAGQTYGYNTAMSGPEAGLGGLGTAGEMLDRFGGEGAYDMSGVHEAILRDVIPGTAHLFSQSGMLDSGFAPEVIGTEAIKALAPYDYQAWENAQNRAMGAYGQVAGMEQGAYEAARRRQMEALGLSPTLMQSRYIDPSMMMTAGASADQWMQSEQDAMLRALGLSRDLTTSRYIDPQMLSSAGANLDLYNNQLLNDAMAAWYEAQGVPYDELQRISSLAGLYGGMGGEQTSTSTQPSNPLAAAGSAMSALWPLMLLMG